MKLPSILAVATLMVTISGCGPTDVKTTGTLYAPAGSLAAYRTWAWLVDRYLDESDGYAVVAESGVQYQVEVQAFWDNPRRPGNLRVIIAIDDGGWRAFRPLSTDFIVASDGSFVGE